MIPLSFQKYIDRGPPGDGDGEKGIYRPKPSAECSPSFIFFLALLSIPFFLFAVRPPFSVTRDCLLSTLTRLLVLVCPIPTCILLDQK